MTSADEMGPAEYARACVERFVTGEREPETPRASVFRQRAACFVSIKSLGQLRGCIGTLTPAEPDLGREIVRNAASAAFRDPRFPPIAPMELETLAYSVDVLSPSEPARFQDLDPARYGVIVSSGPRRGVLLPDLAGIDDAADQVAIALRKAGIAADEPYAVERFTVTRYHEQR